MDDAQLALEKEKLRVERFKAWWTGISVLVSVLIGASTIAVGMWSQKRTAELQLEVQRQAAQAQFAIKAAELAMSADSPDIARGKSLALAQLFPGWLPAGFAQQFDAQVFGSEEAPAKKELIKLLADRPQQRARIIKDWLALFPADEWANNLKQ